MLKLDGEGSKCLFHERGKFHISLKNTPCPILGLWSMGREKKNM